MYRVAHSRRRPLEPPSALRGWFPQGGKITGDASGPFNGKLMIYGGFNSFVEA